MRLGHHYRASLVWPSSFHLMLSQSVTFDEDAFTPPSVGSGTQRTPQWKHRHNRPQLPGIQTLLCSSFLLLGSSLSFTPSLVLLGPSLPPLGCGSLRGGVLLRSLSTCLLTLTTLRCVSCKLGRRRRLQRFTIYMS